MNGGGTDIIWELCFKKHRKSQRNSGKKPHFLIALRPGMGGGDGKVQKVVEKTWPSIIVAWQICSFAWRIGTFAWQLWFRRPLKRSFYPKLLLEVITGEVILNTDILLALGFQRWKMLLSQAWFNPPFLSFTSSYLLSHGLAMSSFAVEF